MKPLQISPETALKLSQKLKVPLEHLMHMPQHILLAKLAELAKEETKTEEKAEEKQEERKEE
jgi:plasmid maintenance system antidote protein VapI